MAPHDDDSDGSIGIFEEPVDFYEPEKKPTEVEHRMQNGQTLKLRLVGHSPLWGHLLWNAGRTIAEYLEHHRAALIEEKTVLELGAGAGLPSLVAALRGARAVVVTDYPDADLIENLSANVQLNCADRENIHTEGYLWGADTTKLIDHLPADERTSGFDLLILADLLFNHSEHGKLLASIKRTLKRTPKAQALVFFTPYRPWLLEKDLALFDLAKEGGFEVEKILEKTMDKVMFEEDPGVGRILVTSLKG